ncbi:hypothetical protein TIFTF001_032005 [Ficus carica]|uniref:HMA domain-containing protein n=1 Tax=Ficus carica TaxID=3494 RepID=A0AA88J661_FICCA|nr:hypothetical protein TIFTF001_032005 [Ficus carica]
MRKLRLLKINSYDENSKKWKVHLPQGLQYLPSSLKYLHWDGYPLKCLPFNFNPKNLVGLVLTNSHIDNLPWQGQDLRHLKLLDLSHSKQLTKIPDLYVQAPNLECLHLQFFTCLAQVPSSFRYLDKLRILNLRGCSSIEEFPMLPRNIRNLDLSETSIGQVPSSIDHLYHLETLNLNMCEKIEFLPGSISSLNSLKELSICCCTKLKHLPDLPLHLQNLNANGCTSLETVSKSGTALAQLQDDSFQHSSGKFDFRNCLKLDQNARAIIVIEAGLRILKMATSPSKDEERGVSETWCPGNEIPKWFSHQFESSSIEIKLPPDWCSTNFLGFALGVVVDFKKCDTDDNFEFYFQFGLTMDSQPHGVADDILMFKGGNDPAGSDHRLIVDSEHLFLFNYCNKNSFAAKNDKNVAEASFKFYSSNKSNCNVKKCGVQLIYAKDVKMILDFVQQVAMSVKTKDAFTADFKDDGHSHEPEASGSVNVPVAHTKIEEEVEKRFHDITQDVGESSSEIEGDDRISDFEDRSTQDFSASEIEEDPISDIEFGTLSYQLESRGTRKEADTKKKEAGDLNPIENQKKKSTYSCSRILSLSPVVDLFKHVLGRRSASDKDPRREERRQAPDIVLHSTMTKLGTHNKQISQHLKTLMLNTSHGSFSSPEMSSPSRVAPSHSTAAEKQLHETSEEIIDSLYSQIVAVEDQNNEILRNLRTLAPTTQDDQFVGLLPELASLPYASSVNALFKDVSADEQHVEVPEDVIHSLRSHLTELQNHNQQILQYLHVAMSNSPDTTGSYQAVQSQVAEEDSGLVSPQPTKEDDKKKKADENDKKKEPDEKKAKEKEPLMKKEEEPDKEEPDEKKAKEKEPLMKKEKEEPDEKKAKERETLMKKEPRITTAVLKVGLHCQKCTNKIVKTIAGSNGVQSVSVDRERELVTVTGSLDVVALINKLRKKLKTHAEVISVAEHSGKAGKDGGDGGKKAVVDFGETAMMSRGLQRPGTAYPMGYSELLMYSDEDPNACFVM